MAANKPLVEKPRNLLYRMQFTVILQRLLLRIYNRPLWTRMASMTLLFGRGLCDYSQGLMMRPNLPFMGASRIYGSCTRGSVFDHLIITT